MIKLRVSSCVTTLEHWPNFEIEIFAYHVNEVIIVVLTYLCSYVCFIIDMNIKHIIRCTKEYLTTKLTTIKYEMLYASQ